MCSFDNASVRVTLEIEAGIPEGLPANVVRPAEDNNRILHFVSNSALETK